MRPTTARLRSAPRWRTLAALTLAVLFAHLYLLAGGWSGGFGTGQTAPSQAPAWQPGEAAGSGNNAPSGAAPMAAAPITSSRVRWIIARPPEPEPAPPPPPASRAAPPKPRPALPPARPAPVDEPLAFAEAPDSLPLPETEPTESGDEAASAELADLPAPATAAQDAAGLPEAPAVASGDAPLPAPLPKAPDEPLIADQALPPAQPPPSARLMYEVTGRVKGINYTAAGSLDWQNDGARYQAHMVVRAFLAGGREQTSVGQLGATGLVPERFGDKSRTERAAHFDGQQQRIRFSNNAPDAPWVAGGQDRLSVFMQLAALLQARPDAYPAGTVVSLQVAGPGDAEVWRFEMGPEEALSLPAGELRARRVTRTPRKPFDTQTELWLAPALNHLPARLRITQHNGDHIEQSLRYLP